MEKFNRLLNRIIVVIIIIIIFIIIFGLVQPLLYGRNSKGSGIKNYDNYSSVKLALDTYILGYTDYNIKTLKSCTAPLKYLSDEQYNIIYDKFFKDKYIKTVIHSINKTFGSVYIVEYSFNMNTSDAKFEEPQKHKIIIKLDKLKQIFKIYYDGLSDEI